MKFELITKHVLTVKIVSLRCIFLGIPTIICICVYIIVLGVTWCVHRLLMNFPRGMTVEKPVLAVLHAYPTADTAVRTETCHSVLLCALVSNTGTLNKVQIHKWNAPMLTVVKSEARVI